ncbi:MAG TPA: hypothetical protein VHA07_13925 [Devosia sp.]|nr:hypothetical protein [Devosia sp.]
MTNLTKLAATALVALTASTSFASAMVTPNYPGPIPLPIPPTNYPGQPDHHHGFTSLECKVRGADFYIMNFGTTTIDSGRQVAWASPTTDDDGVVLLPKMLAPGESVKLADVLSDLALPGSPCSAAFV